MRIESRIISIAAVIILLCFVLVGASAASKTIVINFSLGEKEEAELKVYIKEKYPDCNLKVNTDMFGNAIQDMILTRGGDADVLMVSSKTGLLQSLIEKGFYLDMNSLPEIKEKIDSLYPQLQALVRKDNQIAAYPMQIEIGPIMTWNSDLAQKLMIADKPPESMLDTIELVRAYPEVDLDGKTYTVMYDGGNNPLLLPFVQFYDLHMLSLQGELAYSTTFFKENIAAVLKLSREVDSEDGGWFLVGFVPSSSASSILSFNPRSATTYHVIPLNQERKTVVGLEANCLLINPFTQNRGIAEAVVSWMIAHQDPVDFMGMSPAAQQPIANPDYEKNIDDINGQIEKVQAYIDSPNRSLEEREIFNLQLSEKLAKKEYIEEKGAYLVSADAIKWYQEQVAPFFYTRGNTAFETDTWFRNQSSLFYQVMGGAIGTDKFIMQLDQRARLIALEAKDD